MLSGKAVELKAMRKLLTPGEVAEELRVSERMVRSMMSRRELAHVWIGGKRHVLREDLDAYIESQRVGVIERAGNADTESAPSAKERLRARLHGANE